MEAHFNERGNIIIKAKDNNERILLKQFTDRNFDHANYRLGVLSQGGLAENIGHDSITVGHHNLVEQAKWKRQDQLRRAQRFVEHLKFWRWRLRLEYKDLSN